jgi:colanic acid/amylovoran biosynthesis protein
VKILITNTVALNGGDAAILYAEISLLKAAFGQNIQFIIYDNQPEIANQYHPNLEFRKLLYWSVTQTRQIKYLQRSLQKTKLFRFRLAAQSWSQGKQWLAKLLLRKTELQYLMEYSSADLIISTGGTVLVENYWLEPRIFDYEISLKLGKPLVFFTQSLGPFLIPVNRQALKPIFEKAILILLRDEKSQHHLSELEVENPNISVTSDAVFALADAAAIQQAVQCDRPAYNPLKVAISVREWKYFKQQETTTGMQKYLTALKAASIHLVEKYSAKITYISTCQGIPEYWTDDSSMALKIVETLPEKIKNSVSVNTSFHAPSELAEMMRNYDFAIATRLHMAILTLGVGTPVLPIAYEFKTQELFARFGLKSWVQDIEDINVSSLIETIDSFLESLPQIRQQLFESVEQERQQALKSSKLVKTAFEKWQKAQVK